MPRAALVVLSVFSVGCSSSSTPQNQAQGADAEVDVGATPQGDAQANDGQPSSDDASISDSGDGGTPTCPLPAPSTPFDGGACSPLVATGPVIQETCSDASVPTTHGGVIEDGTYILESATYYGVCPMPQNITRDQVTWTICGNAWQSSQLIGAMRPLSYNVIVGPGDASASLTFDVTCPPDPTPLVYGYDVTPGHLSLVPPSTGGTTEVDSYIRQ